MRLDNKEHLQRYGLTDQTVLFAKMTESFIDVKDFPPFNHAKL